MVYITMFLLGLFGFFFVRLRYFCDIRSLSQPISKEITVLGHNVKYQNDLLKLPLDLYHSMAARGIACPFFIKYTYLALLVRTCFLCNSDGFCVRWMYF